MTLQSILETLRIKGYKMTEPRKVIITLLLEYNDSILSADDLYSMTKQISSKINRSTVYRNIEILSNAGLLFKSVNTEGIARFKLKCSDDHHHHLICDVCGKIIIYDHCNNQLYKQFAKEHGYILTGHTLELHGICQTCQSQTSLV